MIRNQSKATEISAVLTEGVDLYGSPNEIESSMRNLRVVDDLQEREMINEPERDILPDISPELNQKIIQYAERIKVSSLKLLKLFIVFTNRIYKQEFSKYYGPRFQQAVRYIEA